MPCATLAKPCPEEVFNAIEELVDVLNRNYGCDYAFRISACGYLLSASNSVEGVVMPEKEKNETPHNS